MNRAKFAASFDEEIRGSLGIRGRRLDNGFAGQCKWVNRLGGHPRQGGLWPLRGIEFGIGLKLDV